MTSVRELLTSWGVECPSSILAGRASNHCTGCTHPAGIFELLDVEASSSVWGCSAVVPVELTPFREALWAICAVESALASEDLSELLEISSFPGADSLFLDASGRSLRTRIEDRIRARLVERREELVAHVRGLFPYTPLEGPGAFVHYTSSYDFWWNIRVFGALYRQVSLSVDVPTSLEEGVFLVPDELFRMLERREYAHSLDLELDPTPLLLSDWEGIQETALFEEGDLECLEVVRSLLPELGLFRAFESARALRVLS